jgi:hypothetical protein
METKPEAINPKSAARAVNGVIVLAVLAVLGTFALIALDTPTELLAVFTAIGAPAVGAVCNMATTRGRTEAS